MLSMMRIKKKPIIYISTLVGIFLITIIVSQITGVEAGNTWLGIIFANAFFGTITIMLFDVARSIKYTRPLTKYAVYFFPYLMLFILVINNIVFVLGGFNN